MLIQPPDGAPNGIGHAQFSADGSTVVAATDEPVSRLLESDAATGRPIWTLADNDFAPGPFNVSADGTSGRDRRRRRPAAGLGHHFGSPHRRSRDPRTCRVRPPAKRSTVLAEFSPDGKHIDVPTSLGITRFADDLEPVAYVPVPAPFIVSELEHVPESDDVIAVGTGGQIVRVDMADSKVVAMVARPTRRHSGGSG